MIKIHKDKNNNYSVEGNEDLPRPTIATKLVYFACYKMPEDFQIVEENMVSTGLQGDYIVNDRKKFIIFPADKFHKLFTEVQEVEETKKKLSKSVNKFAGKDTE